MRGERQNENEEARSKAGGAGEDEDSSDSHPPDLQGELESPSFFALVVLGYLPLLRLTDARTRARTTTGRGLCSVAL